MNIPCETQDGRASLGVIDLQPTKAICVGRNYRAHAAEFGQEVPTEPLIFMKPVSALLAPGMAIARPLKYERVDHEGELAIVISKRASKIPASDVADYILGYTCANDVTVRDLQSEGPWLRAKGMDTFMPIGPRIVTDFNPEDVAIVVRVNGAEKQRGRTSQFIFGIPEILEYITNDITLEAHDLVLTGTPAGVANLSPGDEVEVEIEGIGILRNPVAGR